MIESILLSSAGSVSAFVFLNGWLCIYTRRFQRQLRLTASADEHLLVFRQVSEGLRQCNFQFARQNPAIQLDHRAPHLQTLKPNLARRGVCLSRLAPRQYLPARPEKTCLDNDCLGSIITT